MKNAAEVSSDPAGSIPSGQDVLLHRILAAVEKSQGRGRLELATAIILSLATLASTWCGFQAGQWGGRQSTCQSAADTAERMAAENTIVALQRRTQDGLVLLELWRAMREQDTKTAETIQTHMNSVLKAAVEASIEGGILSNPDVAGPLQRPEYRLDEEVAAATKREEARRLSAEAATAGQWAGQYVLLTLMFASVLFFGGIGGTFAVKRIRIALASIALLLFAATTGMLLRLPVFGS